MDGCLGMGVVKLEFIKILLEWNVNIVTEFFCYDTLNEYPCFVDMVIGIFASYLRVSWRYIFNIVF